MKQSANAIISIAPLILLCILYVGTVCNGAPPQEHEFTGVSRNRSAEETLGNDLKQLDQAIADQGLGDSMASWRVVEITGQIRALS